MTPKVCMGCFSEWDEYEVCPHCGWQPDTTASKNDNWDIGTVLEKRYLLGKKIYSQEKIKIWHIYDNVLGIPYFALEYEEGSVASLEKIARKLQYSNTNREKYIIALGIKKIQGKMFLLFSSKNRFLTKEKIQKLLQYKEIPQEDLVEIIYDRNSSKEGHVLAPGRMLDGRYRVVGCIGIGGFGVTYVCEDIRMHRNVAIKEYFPAEWAYRDEDYVMVKSSNLLEAYRFGMQSFYKEIKITTAFMHTNHMVSVYDAFETNDTVYMVMNYISGMSIGREIREKGYRPYTPAEMAKIMLPVMEALEAIHDKRIVHSDISPGNIMRAVDGEIYLIDLGAAKYNLESQPVLSATFLKKDYAAPEQYHTAKTGIPSHEGPWTDIYALGATIYYLLTGHTPTDAVSRLSGKTTDLVSPRKFRVRLSKKWMELIHHCVELDRKKRIASVQELATRIKELAAKEKRR